MYKADQNWRKSRPKFRRNQIQYPAKPGKNNEVVPGFWDCPISLAFSQMVYVASAVYIYFVVMIVLKINARLNYSTHVWLLILSGQYWLHVPSQEYQWVMLCLKWTSIFLIIHLPVLKTFKCSFFQGTKKMRIGQQITYTWYTRLNFNTCSITINGFIVSYQYYQ